MNQAPIEKIDLPVLGEKITIDPLNLKFDERSLSEWLQHEPGWVNYFSMKLQLAEKVLMVAHMNYDGKYADALVLHKNTGLPVAIAEAKAKADPDVSKQQERIISAKYIVGCLKTHLRAWDKAHEAAISLGHNLRKEMDRLNNTVLGPAGYQKVYESGSDRIDSLIGDFEAGGLDIDSL